MSRRGVTFIELLITVIIGSIAMLALVVPFSAERKFWNQGKRQTEAQRDAQLVLRAMAHAIREGSTYDGVNFTVPCPPSGTPGTVTFALHPGGVLHQHGCKGELILIDGIRSKAASFTIAPVVPNRLVRVQLDVTHQLRATDPFTENEVLQTEIFLRNGT